MTSRRGRLGLLAAVVVIAVVAFVIAQPGSDNGGNGTKTTSTGNTRTTKITVAPPTRITVKGGKPVGGVEKITVKKGDRLRFTVTSDVADEIHVHGYDFKKEVPAGGTVRFDFPAKIDGSFEVELEQRAEQIASLRVEP